MTTFNQAGSHWLDSLPEDVRRNGKPLSQNTQRAYRMAFNRAAEIVGKRPLSEFDPDVIKAYVAKRRGDSKPATLSLDLAVIKLIVESVTMKGNPVYPLKFDVEYVRAPKVEPEEQHTPVATRADVEVALADPDIGGHVALAAGLGLRISEILALHVGDCPGLDSWDSVAAEVHIRATLKTRAAKRDIPVPVALNDFLMNLVAGKSVGDLLFTVPRNRIYDRLQELKNPPMHSYRRFFTTEKEMGQTPMNYSVLQYVMGHSKGRDITARYNHVATDRRLFVRSEMERCSLGFTIPQVAAVPAEAPEFAMAGAA